MCVPLLRGREIHLGWMVNVLYACVNMEEINRDLFTSEKIRERKRLAISYVYTFVCVERKFVEKKEQTCCLRLGTNNRVVQLPMMVVVLAADLLQHKYRFPMVFQRPLGNSVGSVGVWRSKGA